MAAHEPCPIWGGGKELPKTGDFLDIDNDRAGGLYRITGTAAAVLAANWTDELAAKLTTWIVDQHRFGTNCPTITEAILDYVRNRPRLSITAQMGRFFQFLVSLNFRANTTIRISGPIDEQLRGNLHTLNAWLECVNDNERVSIINLLIEDGLVRQSGVMIVLTPAGVRRLSELQTSASASLQGFVAMWFDASMEEAWELGFEPAIRAAGYSPMRIDKKEHNNKIDDEIIAEIRRSKFVVADFTSNEVELPSGDSAVLARGGVYFEAGLAMGLGIPVIWCCKASLIEKVHFDTRQFSHVTWTNPNDLQKRLYARISAVIGMTPSASGPTVNLSLQDAAQIAYERAERDGWLDNVVGKSVSDPQLRLESFKYMMLVQAQHHAITLHGVKPPSRQSLPIPAGELFRSHPLKGESVINQITPNQIAFHSVTISQDDLEKVIGTYQALATGAFDQMVEPDEDDVPEGF